MTDIEPFPPALAALLTPPPVATPAGADIGDYAHAYQRCLAYLQRLDDAISGSGGHNATFRAACEIYRFGLGEGEAWDALQWFNATKCRPTWSEGELRHKLASARTEVEGAGELGVRLGQGNLHHDADTGEIFVPPSATNGHHAPAADKPKPAPPADNTSRPPVIKDTQLRDLYVRRHPTTACGLGDWYRYEQGVYEKVPESTIAKELQAVIDEQERRDPRLRPTFWLRKGVMGLVRDAITVADALWNRNPDILVCRNGTLVISRRELREHRPGDYVTSGVDYDYDPAATAPIWQRYLDEVVPHARDFLQEFAGLCLTTITDFELAVWLYGPPGGGKSTFIDGIKAMLADRHGVLGLSDIERSQFMLYSLIGRTLVTATENPSDFPIALGKVNQIISGEPITVDLKHKTPIEFSPAAKILWSMNDLPRVTDANNGIFRRVKVIHVKPIAKDRMDPTVKKVIKTEGAGILNWALDGLERLLARGHFEVPEAVEAETNEFKASNDAEQAFVNDECNVHPSGITKSSALYDAYKAWCKANGHGPKSSTRVSKEWERLGFRKEHRRDGAYWTGVQHRQPDIFTGDT